MIYCGGYHYYEVYFAKLKKQGIQQSKVRSSMYQVGAGVAEKITKKVQ